MRRSVTIVCGLRSKPQLSSHAAAVFWISLNNMFKFTAIALFLTAFIAWQFGIISWLFGDIFSSYFGESVPIFLVSWWRTHHIWCPGAPRFGWGRPFYYITIVIFFIPVWLLDMILLVGVEKYYALQDYRRNFAISLPALTFPPGLNRLWRREPIVPTGTQLAGPLPPPSSDSTSTIVDREGAQKAGPSRVILVDEPAESESSEEEK